MHPENLKWPPVILGWVGPPWSQEGGAGATLRGCRQGRQGFSLAPDRAERELDPDWAPSLGAPMEEKQLVVHMTLLVLAGGSGEVATSPLQACSPCPQGKAG